MGFLDGDELFVTGRIKDIEFTVEKSHPALKANSSAAFAVDLGSSERLVIVQELERTYLRNFNKEEVITAINQAVITEHGLRPFAVVLIRTGSLPKTSSGKV